MGIQQTAPSSGEKPLVDEETSDASINDGTTWGPKVFWAGMALMLGLLWYVVIYSGGASPHGH